MGRPDGRPAWRYHRAVRRINETAGLQAGAQIEIEFDPSYQKLQLHRLEIWRDGKRIDKLDRKLVKLLHRETQLERQMVDGRMTASIVLDDLRVGDRVEWASSLVGDNPVFAGKHVDQEWTSSSKGPVGLVQVRLLAPAERDIRHRAATDLGIDVSTSESKGWRETLFRRRAVPQFHHDPLTPPASYLVDQIEFSEFADWAEVAGWADQLFAKAAKGLDALDREIEAIRARANTPEERLRLALDFVQQEIRYFGTEMGVNSHQPAPADQVLRQRFGDCKDKTALLVNLLARLDIKASPVLVSAYTRDHVKTRLPSPLAFDHAIALVKLDEQTNLWLDGTRSLQRGAPATRQSVGLGHGLVASAGSTELSPMPLARDALRSETADTFKFPRLADEGLFESVTVYHGDMAEWLRGARAAMPEDELRKMLVGEIMRAYPSFTLQGAPLIEEVEGSNALRISLRFRTGNYWRIPDKRTLVGDFALLPLITALRLPSQTPRSEAMLIDLPGRYVHKLRFEFGEDVFQQPSSSRFEERNEHFTLQLRYQGDTRSQQVDGELRLLADTIAAGSWAPYRDQLTKVWPRLGTTMNVPALSPTDVLSLRKGLAELGESVRKGSIKVLTNDQATARSRLLVADRLLAADRLQPKLRAQLLVERGIQLDHLGMSDAALIALDQAQKLDATQAETHEALAVNALLRRQDGQARSHAEQALQLSPNSIGPRYTRVWANYFAGELTPARDELKDILQSRTEVERSYGSIWLYLVSRRLGEESAAKAVPLPADGQPVWPFAVLQLMQGKLDLDAALAFAREDDRSRRGRECELYFYAAQKALADRDLDKARTYLRKSLDTGVVEFNEYAMAKRELERIGVR
jgi:lipoprotein NlpI/transglutaminase-like putative cysteine protease